MGQNHRRYTDQVIVRSKRQTLSHDCIGHLELRGNLLAAMKYFLVMPFMPIVIRIPAEFVQMSYNQSACLKVGEESAKTF